VIALLVRRLGYGLDGRGSFPGRGGVFLSVPPRPD